MSDADLGKYLNPEVVKSVERLDLQAKCLVEGFLSGRHRSPFQGSSNQFSEYRHYNSGDPIKSIDWAVYAKTEKYFIKKFEAETDLDCHFCIDISSSMGYKSQSSEFSKLDYTILLSAALAYMITQQKDNIGLIAFDEAVKQYIKPKSSTRHFNQLITALTQISPSHKGNFPQAIPQALKLIKKRGIIIVFSDLLGDTQELFESLAMIRSKKHDVIVFQVLDHAELELPFESIAEFTDSENQAFKVKAKPQDIRDNYKEEINHFIAEIKEKCEALGIDYVLTNTAAPFDSALESFLLKRKRCF